MIPISKLAAAVQTSATLAAGAKAKQMAAEGIQVFDFSLGEPDFKTPEYICKAAVKAMQDGHTKYTPAAGIMELRKAVARQYQTAYGMNCSGDQVVISNGAKHSLHNALFCTCSPGDEVIIPSPYWVSYSDLVQMTGATPVLVETSLENDFKMTPAQLRATINPRSRLLMLNSPSNPTGAVYTRQELEALADVVLDSKLAVLSDEIYERLVYDGIKPICFASVRPGLFERTITVSGVSKTYSMTGWRMGWTVAQLPLVKAMANVQSQQTSSPGTISQHATLAALSGDQEEVEKMRREFEARRDLVARRLEAMPRITFPQPAGAFYFFINVTAHLGRTLGGKKVTDSTGFCQTALESAHVNLVPGVAFGLEGYVRLSFAAGKEVLNAGLDRLQEFLKDQ